MATININQMLLDINGEPIEREKLKKTDNDPSIMEQLTLKSVCVTALLTPKNTIYDATGKVVIQGDTDKQKFEKWDLYKKFRDAEETVSLSSEETILLKNLIAESEPQLICGQCRDFLEK